MRTGITRYKQTTKHLCKLFNDQFDSVGYPCLILENLENMLLYPDELLGEFTDKIEELVGGIQHEKINAKQHLVLILFH